MDIPAQGSLEEEMRGRKEFVFMTCDHKTEILERVKCKHSTNPNFYCD